MAALKLEGGPAEVREEADEGTDKGAGVEIPIANFKSNKLSQIDR